MQTEAEKMSFFKRQLRQYFVEIYQGLNVKSTIDEDWLQCYHFLHGLPESTQEPQTAALPNCLKKVCETVNQACRESVKLAHIILILDSKVKTTAKFNLKTLFFLSHYGFSALLLGFIQTQGAQAANLLNTKNEYGATALHRAAWRGHAEVVKILLQYRAKVDEIDKSGRTALHMAAWKGHASIVEQLLKNGAACDAVNNVGWSVLFCAVMGGSLETMAELLKRGAAINMASKQDGWTALHYAAWQNNPDMVRLLLDKNADPRCVTLKGETPLALTQDESLKRILTNGEARFKKILASYRLSLSSSGGSAVTPPEEKRPDKGKEKLSL